MAMSMGSFATRTVATLVVATDGTGDFTDIQTAINALPAKGGCVYIKEGTYTLTDHIEILIDNVRVEGCGFCTILILDAVVNTDVFTIGDITHHPDNIVIASLKIDGNRAAQTAGVLSGIRLNQESDDCIIENCQIVNCYSYGIYMKVGLRNRIANNYITDCTTIGIYLYRNDASNIIIGNNIQGNDGIGIKLEDYSAENIITGNIINDNIGDGIYIYGANKNIINSNIIENNGIRFSPANGVFLDTSDETVIMGNVIRVNEGYGVDVSNVACDNTIILGNVIKGNSTGQINDAGTDTHPNGVIGTNSLAIDDLNEI